MSKSRSRGLDHNDSLSFSQTLLNCIRSGTLSDLDAIRHIAEFPARPATHAEWPGWAPQWLLSRLANSGIHRPWAHQAAAAVLAASGEHVILATGTASGKSLAYQLPIIAALDADPRATALYLAPTKALAADQLRAAVHLTNGGPAIHPVAYDGDTADDVRQWARAHGRWIFTNPDMLHTALLPGHQRWSRLWRQLRYVVIDEAHSYRGVFGSHVALVLRRLSRIAASYGAAPTFILASATTASPAAAATALTGVGCTAIANDGSPRGPRTIALWEPPLTKGTGEKGAPQRRPATSEAARIMANLLTEGARTLTFVRSRRAAETVALATQQLLAEADPALAERVSAYRAGYLAEDRRALETALDTGQLLGVATTNALELGVDLSGLDAVLMAGYPGTLASFWQQAGRAGREQQNSLVLLIARDDPLDTYLVHHPAALLQRPVEAPVIDPDNPHVLEPHLVCAATELPLTESDVAGLAAHTAVTSLVAARQLRRRNTSIGQRWFPAQENFAHAAVSLRGDSSSQVAIVDEESGRIVGTADAARAPAALHQDAVYLHQGETFVVQQLDLDAGIAFVRAEVPLWNTSARETTAISIRALIAEREFGSVHTAFAAVDVTHQVTGYLRTLPTGEVLDLVPLDLPERRLSTRAIMYTVTPRVLSASGIGKGDLAGALHAAEHTAIGLLPLIATCDRWDVGGLSTTGHPDTGLPTVFVYDGHSGGAGFAERGFQQFPAWLTATRDAIGACECLLGCPSCVQSPKCGNGNQPLHKEGATRLLNTIVRETDSTATLPG